MRIDERAVLAVLCGFCLALGLGSCASLPGDPAPAAPTPSPTWLRIPAVFEQNQGQADASLRFASPGARRSLLLDDAGASIVFHVEGVDAEQATTGVREGGAAADPGSPGRARDVVLRMDFPGANPDREPYGEQRLATRTHYFVGADPERWVTDVPTFASVRYRGLYPGIDLVFHDTASGLEYSFEVAANARPEDIRIRFPNTRDLRLDASGNLLMTLAGLDVVQPPPVVFQSVKGARTEVESGFTPLGAGEVGLRLGAFDRRLPLVIDPPIAVLGSFEDLLAGTWLRARFYAYWGMGLDVDGDGNVYLAGSRGSVPQDSHYEAGDDMDVGCFSPRDAFVVKLDTDSQEILYSVYVGGSYTDVANDVAVDADGYAFVTGVTESNDFSTLAAHQPANAAGASFRPPTCSTDFSAGVRDAFVVALDPSGMLVNSTYFGGGGEDYGTAIEVDAGSVHVAGDTTSGTLPGGPLWRESARFSKDGFVSKWSRDALVPVYSAFVGGENTDHVSGLAVDPVSGDAIVAGSTFSPRFVEREPVILGSADSSAGWTDSAAFVARYHVGELAALTYVNGDGSDDVHDIAVDGDGRTFAVGQTNSVEFPWLNEVQSEPGVPHDVLVFGLAADGESLLFATRLGGGLSAYVDSDAGRAVAVDRHGSVWVTGSAGFEFGQRAGLPNAPEGESLYDAFVAAFEDDGAVARFLYIAGERDDHGQAIAAADTGEIYVAGETCSESIEGYPMPPCGTFVARISGARPQLGVGKEASADPVRPGAPLSFTVEVTNDGTAEAPGVLLCDYPQDEFVVNQDDLPEGCVLQSAQDEGACPAVEESHVIACELGDLDCCPFPRAVSVELPLQAPAEEGSYVNQARVFLDAPGGTAVAEVTATTTVEASAPDLVVDASADAGPLCPAVAVTHTIEVRNDGNDEATDVVLCHYSALGFGVDRQSLASGCELNPVQPDCPLRDEMNLVECRLGNLPAASTAPQGIDVAIPLITPLDAGQYSTAAHLPLVTGEAAEAGANEEGLTVEVAGTVQSCQEQIAASAEQALIVYRLADAREHFRDSSIAPTRIAYDATGRRLAAVSAEGGLRVVDVESGSTLVTSQERIVDVAFDPTDNSRFAVVERRHDVEGPYRLALRDLAGELAHVVIDLAPNQVSEPRIAWASDGTRLAAAFSSWYRVSQTAEAIAPMLVLLEWGVTRDRLDLAGSEMWPTDERESVYDMAGLFAPTDEGLHASASWLLATNMGAYRIDNDRALEAIVDGPLTVVDVGGLGIVYSAEGGIAYLTEVGTVMVPTYALSPAAVAQRLEVAGSPLVAVSASDLGGVAVYRLLQTGPGQAALALERILGGQTIGAGLAIRPVSN